MSFETLWNNDIRLVDPEPSVDWFNKRRAFAEIVYHAALAEMSAPQDKSTCQEGHPRSALRVKDSCRGRTYVGEIPIDWYECSICESLRQVEAQVAIMDANSKVVAWELKSHDEQIRFAEAEREAWKNAAKVNEDCLRNDEVAFKKLQADHAALVSRLKTLAGKMLHRHGCGSVTFDERATKDGCPRCELSAALEEK